MTVGQLGFFMPLVEGVLNKSQRTLASGAVANIQTAALQATNNVTGNNESVFAHIAQYALSCHAAEATAPGLQQTEQLD